MKNQAGIYCLKNPRNHKKYIGSSKNVINRLLEHLSQLENHIHSNKALQEAYDCDGLDYCVLEYISDSDDKEAILACEQKWINYYNTTNKKYGYNKVNPRPNENFSFQHYTTDNVKGMKAPSKWEKILDELARCDSFTYRMWKIVKILIS